MSTTPAKRGPYSGTQRRRREIAETVRDLVVEAGHDSVTFALVAERARMSETTVVYHYPTKDHLLIAGLDFAEDRWSADAGADDAQTKLSLEGLKAAADAVSTDDRVFLLLQAMMAKSATPGHPAEEHFARRARHQVDIFARMIRDRQLRRLAHPDLDPVMVAREVVAMWDGLTVQWLRDPSFSIGDALLHAYRRLAGENVMDARAQLLDPRFGL